MSGIMNSTGAVSGILGTTVATPVGTGTDGYVFTATGAGVAPAWEASAVGGIDCDADAWLYAKSAVSDYSSDSVIEFDVQMKLGSNITQSGNRFTVGTAGWYHIFWKITDHNNTRAWDLYMRRNTTYLNASRSYSESGTNDTLEGGYYGEAHSTLVEVSADDIFDIYGTGRIYGQGTPHTLSWFGGYRLGA